jgi:hypothetical protein
MNEYTFSTPCLHEGTIEPVKSSGKYAGKWMCKINGPKVDSQGMNVKTLYTAPYIGAAKASIAKFLGITVGTVEVSSALSGTKVMSTPTTITQQKEAVPKSTTNEFDVGNDDEFANFDLNAAVSSATKQSPHMNNNNNNPPSSNPYSKALPPQYPKSNHYKSSSDDDIISLRKELEILSAEKDRLNREVGSVKQEALHIRQENERIMKETEDAKDERARLKGQIRAVREEHEKLQSDLDSAKQQKDRAEKEKYETTEVVKELDVEKSKLRGQIRALQEQRDELKSDIKSAVQKNDDDAMKEKNEKELKEFGAEKSKLKGQIRALQEQYDQLKSDVKSATLKKECAEKEAQAALVKKEEYDMEAKTVKKTLESHRAELDRLAKKPDAAASGEPPAKKQKTGKQVKCGTIVKSMKVTELKEEAVARGIDMKTLARINKDELLNMLVVGSPCIIKTDAWDEVVRLRKKFADERQKAEQLEWQRQEDIYRKEEQKRKEREKKQQEQREKHRAEEISKQGEFHSLSVPQTVHGCKLAETKHLLFYGSPRSYNARCTECRHFGVEYTCERCDYDICKDCFKEKTMTPSEKKAEAKRKAALEKERQEAAAERRRLQEEEEEKHRKKWDPKTHFAEKIINPSNKNKDPDGNKSKGFTVWCSDGYGNDGWHSYEGPLTKQFDTTYATKKEANERARYLFHWKNPWGSEPEEIENDQFNKSTKEGMVTYTVTPDDSSTWTVAVVPDAAFAYLDNATRSRHGYDREVNYTSTTSSWVYW